MTDLLATTSKKTHTLTYICTQVSMSWAVCMNRCVFVSSLDLVLPRIVILGNFYMLGKGILIKGFCTAKRM